MFANKINTNEYMIYVENNNIHFYAFFLNTKTIPIMFYTEKFGF